MSVLLNTHHQNSLNNNQRLFHQQQTNHENTLYTNNPRTKALKDFKRSLSSYLKKSKGPITSNVKKDRPHDIRQNTSGLSADAFAEARSTPIISGSVCSSERDINDDSQSLCSIYSFSRQPPVSPIVSSVHNHTFYFNTPPTLPPQQQQGDTTDYFSQNPLVEQSIQRKASTPFSYWRRKKNAFLQYSTNRLNTSSSAASLKSTQSARRSWRDQRVIKWMQLQPALPDFETQVFCPQCEKYVQTRLRYRNGSMVYLVSFVLLLCTVIFFWVPFYVKYFKDVSHYCPGCGKQLGISRRL